MLYRVCMYLFAWLGEHRPMIIVYDGHVNFASTDWAVLGYTSRIVFTLQKWPQRQQPLSLITFIYVKCGKTAEIIKCKLD